MSSRAVSRVPPRCLSVALSKHTHLSLSLSVCLSVCLSVFLPLSLLFCPLHSSLHSLYFARPHSLAHSAHSVAHSLTPHHSPHRATPHLHTAPHPHPTTRPRHTDQRFRAPPPYPLALFATALSRVFSSSAAIDFRLCTPTTAPRSRLPT
jgi:hypothetical protein